MGLGANIVDTDELAIHPVLKATHSLQIDTFNLVVRGDNLTEDSLTEAERRELKQAKQLGANIHRAGQENPVKVAMGENGRPTLVQGYLRYLGCQWEGIDPDWTEPAWEPTTDQVALHSLAENENRFQSDPYRRAVNIAIALDCWDATAETYRQSRDAETPTLGELADRLGRSKSTIHRWLSPVRQSDAVRDEFAGVLSESLLREIESRTPTDAAEYALAQAVAQSDEIQTREDFRTIASTVSDRLGPTTPPDRVADAIHDRIRNPPRNHSQSTTTADTASTTTDDSASASTSSPTSSGGGSERPEGDGESPSRSRREFEYEQRQHDQGNPSTANSRTQPAGQDDARAGSTTGESVDSHQSTLDAFTVTIEDEAVADAIEKLARERGESPDETVERIVKTFFRERGSGSIPEPPERPLAD